jgi:hypothetical protein
MIQRQRAPHGSQRGLPLSFGDPQSHHSLPSGRRKALPPYEYSSGVANSDWPVLGEVGSLMFLLGVIIIGINEASLASLLALMIVYICKYHSTKTLAPRK